MARQRTTRFYNINLQGPYGQEDTATNSTNTRDTFIKTFEIPLTRVASGALQTTNIEAGTKAIQIISAYIDVTTAETTAATKTLTVGIGGAAANVLGATSVAATGAVGTPLFPAIPLTSSNNKFTYTLAGADFATFVGTAIVTAVCTNAL
jgi:hypothetical protein